MVRIRSNAGAVAMALGLSLAVLGCKEGPTAGADTDGEGESDGDEDSDGVEACEPDPGRVGLRRLTRSEYDRTVRDLFGVTSSPASAFPPDSSTGGFDNNARSLTISPQLASLLLDAAEQVAAEAMAGDAGEIIACDPSSTPGCTRSTLRALARRVYRRPPTEAELDDLEQQVAFAEAEGDDFAGQIEHALAAMLVAPQFLYLSVPADSMGRLHEGERVPLNDHALASRLSYFVWGSTPDDALLDRADEGQLHDPDVLRAELDRMLADPRAEALYESFLAQWLQLGKLAAATPDPDAFPRYGDALQGEMLEETRLFFEDLRQRDGSMLELLTSTRTFASEDLAAIYGVDGVSGSQLVPIQTDPSQRAGILTMPAVLTMTSDPLQPNIVKRGVWLAESLLCLTPPPPPEGIPPAPAPSPGETERERLERHREDPSCASCHELIDPLGFGFEPYDALGHFRETVEGQPVDDLGTLPDGTTFQGAVELAQVLAEGDAYSTCVSTKLMTYALGRVTTADEQCMLASIGLDHVTPDSTLSDLVWAVVHSDAFQTEIAG